MRPFNEIIERLSCCYGATCALQEEVQTDPIEQAAFFWQICRGGEPFLSQVLTVATAAFFSGLHAGWIAGYLFRQRTERHIGVESISRDG
jgi:hypothetical protein